MRPLQITLKDYYINPNIATMHEIKSCIKENFKNILQCSRRCNNTEIYLTCISVDVAKQHKLNIYDDGSVYYDTDELTALDDPKHEDLFLIVDTINAIYTQGSMPIEFVKLTILNS